MTWYLLGAPNGSFVVYAERGNTKNIFLSFVRDNSVIQSSIEIMQKGIYLFGSKMVLPNSLPSPVSLSLSLFPSIPRLHQLCVPMRAQLVPCVFYFHIMFLALGQHDMLGLSDRL